MRILFDYRPALRHRTGVGEFAHGLATALQAALRPPDTLTLFSSSWKDRLPADVVPGAGRVDAVIPVRALNYAWHRWEWPPAEWLAGTIDIVHAQHPLLMPARAAAQVVTIHDLFFLDHPDQTAAEIRRDYAQLAASHARRADAVIVSSEHTRQGVVARLGVDPDRVTLCAAGAPAWSPRAEPVMPGPILFLGTVEPRKNLPGLLKAYARLLDEWPEAPDLIIAGRVPAAAVPVLETLTPGRLGAKVRVAGYVSDDERMRLYHEALMVVIPSFDEGFGLPALEAMTLGVPVVASRRGSLPEVLGDAAVFIEPDDDADLAAAMGQVASEAALRKALAAAGVRQARLFRWESAAARAIEAYRRASDRRGRR